MKKVTVTFEITQRQTFVIAENEKGVLKKVEMTYTDIEKDFVKLLKKVQALMIIQDAIKDLS